MSQHQRDKQAYLNATPMQREVVRRHLCDVLACLRAAYLSYQTSHWQVVGQSFYGNHLLFARLYESVQKQVDELAEKLVGYLGREVVGLDHQIKHIAAYTMRWSQIGCHHKRGLQSEADLQASLKRAYDGIKQVNAMTLGLDDWIMATANAHEENEYLLQQALTPVPGQKQAAYPNIDRYPPIRAPRGWQPPSDLGCPDEYMDDFDGDFLKTSERFIKRMIVPALKARGWTVESWGSDNYDDGTYSKADHEYGMSSGVEVTGKAGQKIAISRNKYVVLDRNVNEEFLFYVQPTFDETEFEGSEQWDVDEFSEYTWEAECPFDQIESLAPSQGRRLVVKPTKQGIEELLEALSYEVLSKVRSKIKKKGSTNTERYYYKATDGKWYVENESYEEDWETGEQIEGEMTHYGPFPSFEAAEKYMRRNFANSGSYSEDDSGRQRPPRNPVKPGRSRRLWGSGPRLAFNKYNPDDLLAALVDILEKYELDDAVDEVKKITRTVQTAWRGRERTASGASSAEGVFYDNPEKKEVLEFAQTGAISNNPEVAATAAGEEHLDVPEAVAVEEAEEAPPTPTEIVEEPGGAAVSTLNRLVVQSEDPDAARAAEINRVRMAAWLRELDRG